MTDEAAYLTAKICRVETLIAAVEAAIETVSNGGVSYSVDSGQTRQSVTRSSLSELVSKLDSLENRRATLIARRDGGSVYARPEV